MQRIVYYYNAGGLQKSINAILGEDKNSLEKKPFKSRKNSNKVHYI